MLYMCLRIYLVLTFLNFEQRRLTFACYNVYIYMYK